MTSELRTKNGESSLPRMSRASASGPAGASVHVSLSLGIRWARQKRRTSAQGLGLDGEVDFDAVLLLGLLKDRDHDLGAVVDGKDNVLDTSLTRQHGERGWRESTHLDEGLDLVQARRLAGCERRSSGTASQTTQRDEGSGCRVPVPALDAKCAIAGIPGAPGCGVYVHHGLESAVSRAESRERGVLTLLQNSTRGLGHDSWQVSTRRDGQSQCKRDARAVHTCGMPDARVGCSGRLTVSGLRRVPKPPTRIRACTAVRTCLRGWGM